MGLLVGGFVVGGFGFFGGSWGWRVNVGGLRALGVRLGELCGDWLGVELVGRDGGVLWCEEGDRGVVFGGLCEELVCCGRRVERGVLWGEGLRGGVVYCGLGRRFEEGFGGCRWLGRSGVCGCGGGCVSVGGSCGVGGWIGEGGHWRWNWCDLVVEVW